MNTIDNLNVGDVATFAKTISESDIYNYVGIVGDINPLHINEEYAKNTKFEKRIAHGILVVGLISTVIGNKLPGEGTIYLSQSVNFILPVYIGDTITAFVEVVDIDKNKNRVLLSTQCKNQRKEIVISGEAVVKPPKAMNTGSNI